MLAGTQEAVLQVRSILVVEVVVVVVAQILPDRELPAAPA
jgi:hypothetical protein